MDKSKDRTEIFSRCRRILIKVGSAVLTGPKGLDRVMIHRLSDQIAELRERNARMEVLIVSSGAVASGMRRMGITERPRTIPHKQAAAAVGQGALMEAWEAAFDKYDLLVAQVLLTSEDLANRRRYLNARNTLETLLSWGILPIMNENDTVVVEEIKFGDNDHLSALIAGLVGADLVINLTDTDGLYDRDPRLHASARLIPIVHRVDAKVLGMHHSGAWIGRHGRNAEQSERGPQMPCFGHCDDNRCGEAKRCSAAAFRWRRTRHDVCAQGARLLG